MLSSRQNICVRSGFHCAQPGLQSLGQGPTVRASLGVYNTMQEVDSFVEALLAVLKKLR